MMRQIHFLPLTVLLLQVISSCSREESDPDVTEVRIEVVEQEAVEGEAGKFLITLSARLNSATTVTYDIEGNATNGTDYDSIPNVITIPANRLNVALDIVTTIDEHEESAEDLLITLTGTDSELVVIAEQRTATLIIADPPPPPPPFELLPSETRSYMVNPGATDETVALFYNLKELSRTQFIVGQQDAFNAFYNNTAGESDMKKTTGSDPGLLGSDFIFITDDLNDETPSNWFFQQEQIVKEDVVEAYNKGMVNIFTWHFREPYEGVSFYTSEMTEFQRTNAFKSILPGGENHGYYQEKLDKVAEVAQSVMGNDGQLVPIIFRPFHEFDGDWFWWGRSYCTPSEFIAVWRFTVEYLRDTKGVNNMLFAFSPDNRFSNRTQYLERYPGDDFVDIMGMDNYGDFNSGTMMGVDQANQKLKIISDLSLEKVKIAALTESCFFVTPGENSPLPNFYSENLYNALTGNNVQIGFMMFWYNSQNTYCVPPPGQSATADFIEFANKPATALAADLPAMYVLPEDPI